MHINLFSLAGFLIATTCIFYFFLLLFIGKLKLHKIWALYNLAIGIWGIGSFLVGSANEINALFAWRVAYFGALFTCVFFYHTISVFCNLKNKIFLYFSYGQAILFTGLVLFTDLIFPAKKLIFVFDSLYYYKISLPCFILLAFWLFVTISAHYVLFRALKSMTGVKRIQALYFLNGSMFGFLGGFFSLVPQFGLNIYPISNFLIIVYPPLITYAILRYRLMDINVVITRTGIFILVYSVVIGIPFAIALGLRVYLDAFFGAVWWMVPLIASSILGAFGPFFYLFIQRKAEEKLLAEQKRYQATLKQASTGMMRIKDLNKLLNLIVYILARAVRLSHAYLYLQDPKTRDYLLEAARGEKALEKNSNLSRRSALISYLEEEKLPIVYEEIKQQSQDYNSEKLRKICDEMGDLKAAVAIPILTEKRLLAVGILGNKKSGAMYTADDLTVFSILTNQVALAIENAQFFEESKHTNEQLFQAEKMATIGTMADGLSHQINNRLHTLGFIAGDALDTIKMKKDLQDPGQFREVLDEVEKALAKIQDNVRQGGEVVQGLLRYSRKGQEGFNDIVFDKLIDDVIEMAQFKIKKEYVSIVKDYPQDVPALHGNTTQLQEVFFNIIDNAYDAIMQKRAEIPDENFKGKINISTRLTEKYLEINVQDNGMGVKEEDQGKLFTPFFTTKASSRKGTGLGLYVIRKIVEDNHQGEILISSDYKIGTLFVVKLPVERKA